MAPDVHGNFQFTQVPTNARGKCEMRNWLDAYNPEPFIPYSTSHWAALMVGALILIGLYASRHWFRQSVRRMAILRYTLAGVLVLCEVSLNVWYVSEGVYHVRDTLPLELCTISLYLSIFMLWLRSRRLFQIVYFTGIGGAIQALLTPALGYGFPHYRFLEFFIAHIAIIAASLYMVWMEGYRPTFKSIWITMGSLNLLLPFVYLVNMLTGGNYMFIARKPETGSLLDYLGPHPWYILSMEAVALMTFFLLYLPFARPKPRREPGL